MKKILALLLFLPVFAQAQVFDTCVVSGKLFLMDGSVKDSVKVMVVKTVARGTTRPIIIQTRRTFYTDSNGNISMPLLRNSDVTFESNAYGLTGKTLTIPDAATATLESLVPAATVPSLHIVAVPNLTVYDSTSDATYPLDSLRLGSGITTIAPTNGGGAPTIIATATGGATDTTGYFARYGGVMTESDPVWTSQKVDYYTKSQVKPLQDSVKAAADTLVQHRVQIDTKQNVLTAAQIARLDSSLASGYAISITSAGTIKIIAVDTSGFFAAFGGVMTESDPLSIAKDTASLAVYGDQMYPRAASMDTSITARSFVLAPTGYKYDDTTKFKIGFRPGKTDFYFYRSDPAGLYGAGMMFGGPTTATDKTIRNFFGEIHSSGNFKAPTLTATNTMVVNGTSAGTITLANISTVKGLKFYGGDSDTVYTFWYGGAPLFKIRGAATDDEAVVVGSAAMQRGIKSYGRIVVQEDSLQITVAPNEVIDASTGNVFRGTLAQNDTLTVTNMVDGQSITVWIRQAGTFTLLLPGVNWPGGTAPTITAVAGKVDRLTISMSGNIMRGDYVQNYSN